VEAEEVFLCFYLFILIFLSRFYLTFLSLFEFPGRELFDCNPELRLARIAPREYAALFAALKRTNFKTKLQNYNFFPRFPRFNFTLKMSGEILVLDDKFICQFVKC